MALTKKSNGKRGKETDTNETDTKPTFPYTTKPSSLRRLLKEIPKRPKPQKFDKTLLRSWGFTDTNDLTILRVLKAVSLLNNQNEPTETYVRFMNIDEGAKVLGQEVRRVYAPLFQASHTPYAESTERLQNLFNIHSGGGQKTLDLQIQAFKALCENGSFDSASPVLVSSSAPAHIQSGSEAMIAGQGSSNPVININLHIHLPENKSRRDYEDIIEDIGRYIFGRQTGSSRE